MLFCISNQVAINQFQTSSVYAFSKYLLRKPWQFKPWQLLLHWPFVSTLFLWLPTGENLSGNERWRNPWGRRKKRCLKLVNWLSHGRGNLGLGNSPLQRHIYLCKQRRNSQDLGPVRQSEYHERKGVWLKMNILSKHPFFQLCLWAALEWEQGFASVLSRVWSCFAPVLSLLWVQRQILGVGEVPGCPTASTPRGMQGFTSTPALGVPLVGHCLFWSKSAGWGIKEAF